MENDQVMGKESENSDKAIKRGIIHQNQFLEEYVSDLFETIKVVKEYLKDKNDHRGRREGN